MTGEYLSKIFQHWLDAGNEFSVFLVLVILGLIAESCSIAFLFYKLEREKNLRVTDRDIFAVNLKNITDAWVEKWEDKSEELLDTTKEIITLVGKATDVLEDNTEANNKVIMLITNCNNCHKN